MPTGGTTRGTKAISTGRQLESGRDLAVSTWTKAKRMLETRAFPWLGRRPSDGICTADVLAVLRRLESQDKIESTQRLRQICGQVFRYAVATDRLDKDPTSALMGALKTAGNWHYASITEPAKVGELLRAIDGYTGSTRRRMPCCMRWAGPQMPLSGSWHTPRRISSKRHTTLQGACQSVGS